jgi:predicted Zn-dependent peptidase
MTVPTAHTIEKIVLPNGLTLILDSATQFRSASVIITAVGGSRVESAKISGAAHLLEHLLFKRTKTLDAKQIAAQIDDFGGEINAFTDSESLCLYGTVIKSRVLELFEFLSDMLLQPDFNKADLAIEKLIVRQEILEAQDDVSDFLSQEFRKLVWANDPLAAPIFGTPESVHALGMGQMKHELKKILQGKKLVIAISGVDANRKELLDRIDKLYGTLEPGERPKFSSKLVPTSKKTCARPSKQTHLHIGWGWPDLCSDRYLAGMCLVSLLGYGVSSRLFQVLREEEGLCYDLGLNVDAYPDTAYCDFYSVFEPQNFLKITELLKREIDNLCSNGVREEEFLRTKRLIRAQLEMEEDSPRGKLWRAVESEIAHERLISTDEILGKLELVTKDELEKISSDYLAGPRYVLIGGKVPKKIDSI